MKKIIEIVFGALVGGLIGLSIVWYAIQADLSGKELMIGGVMIFISFILHIIIHEGGHLVFGMATGYQFVSFRVFSLMLQKTPSGIEVKRQKVPGTLGQCLLAPPKFIPGKFPFKLYLLGGGLANFMSSFLAIILAMFFPGISFYLLIFAIIGIFIGLMNLIPSGFNDGMSLKLAWQNERIQELFYRQLYLNYQMSQGIALNDLPKELFEVPAQADGKNYYEIWTFFIAYSRELEAGNLSRGKEILALIWQVREDLIEMYQASLELEMVYCLANLEPENQLASQLFEKKKNQQFLKIKMMGNERVKAAYQLYVKNDPSAAITHCQRGLTYQKQTPILTDALMEEKLLWQLLAAAKEQLNEPIKSI